VPFGTAPAAGVTVGAQGIVDRGLEGTEFRLVVERREATIRLAVPGRHNVTNAPAAAAAAPDLGVDIAAVQAGLEAFQPPGMRMEVTQLPTGVTVLNDAYNANPASMAAALSTLAASRGRRRLAALGEMRELGEEAPRAHRELGAAAAGARLDALFLLGPHAAEVRAGAEAAGLPALTLSLVLGPMLIRRLSALQIGQAIRSDGPANHATKAGTPTMGGTLIIFSLLLATLMLADLSVPYVWIALLVTLGHGLVGFLDDYAKVRRRSSAGIPGRVRLAAEFAIAGAAALAVYLRPEHGGQLNMPFLKDVHPDLGLWYVPFGALVVVGAANAVNLTDGLDGLAIGPVMIAGGTYAVFA